MSGVIKLCFGFNFLLFSLFLVTDAAITSPPDQEACVGDDVTIPWEYSDADADISTVIWRVNTSTDIMTYFGSGSTRDPVNGYNVVASNDRGGITITSATRSNSGTYQIEATATQSTSDQVEVLICDATDTSQLTGTKSGSEWKCEASNVGDSDAEIYIKVNGKRRTSSSAKVGWFDKVECCLNGCAVKCMNNGPSDYCEVVQKPTTTTTSPLTTTPTTKPTTANPPTTTESPCDRTCIITVSIVVPLGVIILLSCCISVCYLHRRKTNKKKDSTKVTHSNQSYGNDIVMTSDTRDFGENNRL